MSCPECNSDNIECVKSIHDGSNTETEEYQCLDCGCEYEWEMTRTITAHGEDYEHEGEDD